MMALFSLTLQYQQPDTNDDNCQVQKCLKGGDLVVKTVSEPPEALKPGISALDNKPVLALLCVIPVQMKFVRVLPFLRI